MGAPRSKRISITANYLHPFTLKDTVWTVGTTQFLFCQIIYFYSLNVGERKYHHVYGWGILLLLLLLLFWLLVDFCSGICLCTFVWLERLSFEEVSLRGAGQCQGPPSYEIHTTMTHGAYHNHKKHLWFILNLWDKDGKILLVLISSQQKTP